LDVKSRKNHLLLKESDNARELLDYRGPGRAEIGDSERSRRKQTAKWMKRSRSGSYKPLWWGVDKEEEDKAGLTKESERRYLIK